MTIYKWSFATPLHMRTTDISGLIHHLKNDPATEVQMGNEVSVTPPFFNGEQVLQAFQSPRSDEGVVGKLIIRNRETRMPFLVVRDYATMDQKYGAETIQLINRDNLLAVIMQGDGRRGMYVHSAIAYSPKGEQEGFWQRKR